MTRAKVAVELFKDTKKEWRWRAIASNGKIIATSGEGYKRIRGATNGFAAFYNAVLMGRIYVKE